MIFFESLLVALSTYSAVPVPQFEWNERNMKYAICFLPVVGILCGILLWGWHALCQHLAVNAFFFAATGVCIPLFVSGGIHMDGYMDTIDALASHQTKERKLEILKDSNCGAFSVIYCVVYLILQTAFLYILYGTEGMNTVYLIFVLSRVLSVLCAVNMPKARQNGMLHAYTENAKQKKVTIIMLLVAIAVSLLMIYLSPYIGGLTLCFGLMSVLIYCRMAKKQFGGVTGDTAGFFLQLCELFCIIGAWVGVLFV